VVVEQGADERAQGLGAGFGEMDKDSVKVRGGYKKKNTRMNGWHYGRLKEKGYGKNMLPKESGR